MSGSTVFGRILSVLGATVFGFLSLAMMSAGTDHIPLPVADQDTEATFARECEIARGNGLTQVAERRSTGNTLETVQLAPGACFALVARTTGGNWLVPFEVRNAEGVAVAHDPDVGAMGFVRHGTWCSVRGGRYTVLVSGGDRQEVRRFEGSPPRAQWPLARAMPTPVGIDEHQHALADARFVEAQAGQTAIARWEGTLFGGAMLVPATPGTRAAIREGRGLGEGVDIAALTRVTDTASLAPFALPDGPRPRGVSETVLPSEGTRLATLPLLGDSLATLVALDPGALRRRCVTVRAMTTAPTTETLYRVEVPGWRVQALVPQDGVVSDRRCATDGLTLYATNPASTARYRVVVDTEPGADDPSAQPSAWRGEDPRAHSLFARLQSECRTTASACITLGTLGRTTLSDRVRPDAEAAFRQACALRSAEGCAHLAEREANPASAQAHFAEACSLGMASACMIHARRARLGTDGVAFNASDAYASYARACTLGDTAGCHQRDTMQLLQLTP